MTGDEARPIEIPIGERIKFYREASKRTQVSVAARAGISVDYLYQIERGLKVPSMPVLLRLAAILRVSVSSLLSEPAMDEDRGLPWGIALGRALIDVEPLAPGGMVDLDGLRDRMLSLWGIWQSSPRRYSHVTPLLPDLIRDVGQATRSYRSPGEAPERREAFRIAADTYLLVRAAAKQLMKPDLALMAAARGQLYAETADDPIRIGAARWNLAQASSSHNDPAASENLTLTAARELEPETKREGPNQRDALAIFGILNLLAAVAEVRQSDVHAALNRIRNVALPIGQKTGETNAYWMVFGPANIATHVASVHTEAGEAVEALRAADEVELSSLGSVERRASHLLTIGRAYEYRGDDGATLVTLLNLEREAPEDLRYRPLAHDLVRGLLNRARPSFAPAVRELAGRMGLFG